MHEVATRNTAETNGAQGIMGPGIVLGLGLGGLADGIILHQVLQWHHLISSTADGPMNTVAGLEANALADGLFHATAWVLVAMGLWWVWSSPSHRRTTRDRQFLGWLLLGWGLFNVADEVLFHALLGLHHIREGDNELAYDMGFTALGLALTAIGWILARSPRDMATPS